MVSRVKCKQNDEMLAGIIYSMLVDVTPGMCMDGCLIIIIICFSQGIRRQASAILI